MSFTDSGDSWSTGRSLFESRDGDDARGDLLSDGFDDLEMKGGRVGEDVEGESLATSKLVGEEEGPEDEGEGPQAFTSRLAQEEGPEDEGEGPQAFTSRLANEEGPEDEGEGPQAFTSRLANEEGPEDEGEGPQAFTSRLANEEGPEEEGEGQFGALGGQTFLGGDEIGDDFGTGGGHLDSVIGDDFEGDGELELVAEGPDLEMGNFDF